MKQPQLSTPILHKTGDDLPWLDDERLFYVLAADGLYRCRNHPFFRSCVKAPSGPLELEAQEPFLEPAFPRIPRETLEAAVGFFVDAAVQLGAEAVALLVWDPDEARVRLVVPRQTATVTEYSSGRRAPIGVSYQLPPDLPSEWVVFGDIHSHVDGAAYCSHTDREDEAYSAGLHVVIGRVRQEPPEFHIEAVADGTRFDVDLQQVFEGYHRRSEVVPREWLDQIEVDCSAYTWSSGWTSR